MMKWGCPLLPSSLKISSTSVAMGDGAGAVSVRLLPRPWYKSICMVQLNLLVINLVIFVRTSVLASSTLMGMIVCMGMSFGILDSPFYLWVSP
jgi:hypothetical protein